MKRGVALFLQKLLFLYEKYEIEYKTQLIRTFLRKVILWLKIFYIKLKIDRKFEQAKQQFNYFIEYLRLLHLRHHIRTSFNILLGVGAAITLYVAVHLWNIFFGINSLSVYISLHNKSSYLKEEIDKFHMQNAQLQKKYFELKNLEPEQQP